VREIGARIRSVMPVVVCLCNRRGMLVFLRKAALIMVGRGFCERVGGFS